MQSVPQLTSELEVAKCVCIALLLAAFWWLLYTSTSKPSWELEFYDALLIRDQSVDIICQTRTGSVKPVPMIPRIRKRQKNGRFVVKEDLSPRETSIPIRKIKRLIITADNGVELEVWICLLLRYLC